MLKGNILSLNEKIEVLPEYIVIGGTMCRIFQIVRVSLEQGFILYLINGDKVYGGLAYEDYVSEDELIESLKSLVLNGLPGFDMDVITKHQMLGRKVEVMDKLFLGFDKGEREYLEEQIESMSEEHYGSEGDVCSIPSDVLSQ